MKIMHTIAGSVLLLSAAAMAQPYGMGPGMMGGGPGGYGHGGYGMGYGMGPGMGYGMGPGMMWGNAGNAYAGLDLSAEQRKQIAEIEQEASRAMWQQMGAMHEQGYRMNGMCGAGPLDEDAARKSFQAMTDARKAMFETQLQARKKIDAVLTGEQRERLRRSWGGR
jgi:Spy/CpxP family protein refolding chaperone